MKFSSFVRLFAQQWSPRSSQRRERTRARRNYSPAKKPNPTLERLEDRTLMSVLPPPAVLGHTNLSQEGLIVTPGVDSPSNQSNPSVAVDPLDPNKAVAVYQRFDTSINR